MSDLIEDIFQILREMRTNDPLRLDKRVAILVHDNKADIWERLERAY